jgi:hypothetical protein
MQRKIEKHTAGDNTTIAIGFRRTTIEGLRGVVWEWTEWENRHNEDGWSDANGTFATMAEARENAADVVACWTMP